MMNFVVDDKLIIKCHQSKIAVLANLYVLKSLFEFVLRRSEEFCKSIECARANPIELGVKFSSVINRFLVVNRMKEHIGIQHELRQGVRILVDNVLTELLQQVANFPDVIRIGIEFELRALRERLSDQAASKAHDEYCARSLFAHLRFSFHILISVQTTDDQLFFEPVMCVRFGIECLDFDISRAFIEMDRLIQGSVGLQTKDVDSRFASVPFQLS